MIIKLCVKKPVCVVIIFILAFVNVFVSFAQEDIKEVTNENRIIQEDNNSNDHKIYMGTVNGNKVYNCYGKDRYMIIEIDGEEKVFQGYQAIAIAENNIFTVHYERVFKKFELLDCSGELIEKYNHIRKLYRSSNSKSIIHKFACSIPDEIFSNVSKDIIEINGHSIIDYNISVGGVTYFYYFGSKAKYGSRAQTVKIDGYSTCVGGLCKYVYHIDDVGSLHRGIEQITNDVFMIQVDGGNLYYQKLQDNHKYDENGIKVYNTNLYDLNGNKILKDFDGKAIVKDGLIAYKEGDILKIVSVENPDKLLGSAKVDYKIVNLERLSYGDIIYVKYMDEHIEYVDFNDLLKDAKVSIENSVN